MSNEHPLNVENNKLNMKRNLLKGGKINALLDQMERDAIENWAEAETAVHAGFPRAGLKRYSNYDWEMKKLKEDLQIQKDAYALSRSIRKYAPFIESGAMTIAEAISCEIQRTAGKHSEEKK